MRAVITSISDDASRGEFVNYLHAVREDERVALARKIHDELGGLLVSAAMDLGWAESHLPGVHVLGDIDGYPRNVGTRDYKTQLLSRVKHARFDSFHR
jgi:hypothetical protein